MRAAEREALLKARPMPPAMLCGHWTFWPKIGEEDALRCELPDGHDGLHKCWWSPSTGESFSWADTAERHERPAATAAETYRIALRYDDLGLDDIVVKDVAMFRMERMDDDYVWIACYLKGGEEIVFDLERKGKKILYTAREPLPNVEYEDGIRG